MNHSRVLAIAIIALTLLHTAAQAQQPAPGEPERPPEQPSEQPPEQPPPPPDSLALAKEGRQFLKQKDLPRALATLSAAVEKGKEEKLDDEGQSTLHFIYALALIRADKDDQALQELRTALKLNPQDSEIRVTLAQELLDLDKAAAAKQEAEAALQLGITDKDDLEQARSVLKAAKSELLHDRLTVSTMVSWAYDSNVLQGGPIIRIAGKSLRNPKLNDPNNPYTRKVGDGQAVRSDVNFVVSNYYNNISPSTTEWDLPLNLDLGIDGRLFGRSGVELWLGYRFQQTFMMSVAFDHDDLNFQEHDIPLRLEIKPARWLFLRAKAEGFVNFSGLKDFSPYQGGLNAGLETWFIESKRWKTRLIYQHQLRRSFDQASDQYLNADRDEVKLIQELKIRGKRYKVRGSLGYRFRSDRAGIFTTTQDINFDTALTAKAPDAAPPCFPLKPTIRCTYPDLVRDSNTGMPIKNPETGQFEVNLGYYNYNAPLSYLSHELSTKWTFSVPGGVDLAANFSWEYLSYPDAYTATFTQLILPTTATDPGNWPVIQSPKESPQLNPPQQRTDNLFTVYAGVAKKLPHDFSLELSYTFIKNLSTIANFVDNRNYDKHVVQLGGYYTF